MERGTHSLLPNPEKCKNMFFKCSKVNKLSLLRLTFQIITITFIVLDLLLYISIQILDFFSSLLKLKNIIIKFFLVSYKIIIKEFLNF